MKRSFVTKAILTPRGETIHKVLRDDQLQMQNCTSEKEAKEVAEQLNYAARLDIGNAHRLRNDVSIPLHAEGLVVRAWSFDEEMGIRVYTQVLTKQYGPHWVTMRRPVIFKNFAKNFHPQQRALLAFTIEYIRSKEELAAVNRSANYKSGRREWRDRA